MNATRDSIAEIAAHAFAERAMPAMAISVVRDGTLAYAAGFGYTDRFKRNACTPDSRFAVGSVSKQFTALAVLLLVREGAIDLEAPLASFFPALPNAQSITVHHLLTQCSGLHNYPNTLEHRWPLRGPVEIARILDILARDKPDFAPGTRFAYSNANYAVLSAIIEKAAGMKYGTFLQERIFKPAGMSQSGYGFELQRSGALAVRSGWRAWLPPITLDLFAGAGGIISTANDMAKWNQALLNGSLLAQPLMGELWRAGRTQEGNSPYAMGFVAGVVAGRRCVWHNGFAPGAGGYCYNALFPDDALAVTVLSNGELKRAQGKPERLVQRILAAVGCAAR